MRIQTVSAGVALLLAGLAAVASPVDADRIGKSLTAAGSSVEADGPIPKYEGRDVLEPGWTFGKNRQASWKYRGEKPLYTIDASNLAQHATQLTPGQQAVFKSNPDYKMDVYPTHRSCAYPDFVIENTKRNVKEAKLGADGNSIATGVLPGLPFPGTQNGLEAIWNHLVRYSGLGYDTPVVRTFVSPRPGSDGWIDTVTDTTMFFPLNKRGANKPTDFGATYLAGFVKFLTPAALAGQSLVQRSMFGEAQETYFYFPGQRRVRRMPTYAYDAPMLGYENQIMVDASFTFNGNPDRYDWKLVGEKPMIVPYNAFAMYDNEVKVADVTQPKSVGQKVRRYELHKVYVVEATVKGGRRHSAPKRVFYLDADTYLALVADDYDEQGKLWKYRESYAMPVHELGGACAMVPYSQYDMQSGRYIVDFVTADTPAAKGFKFYLDSNEPRFKLDFYTQDNLRAISER